MSISETNAINISKVLTEALPYIRKFNNKVVVINYGGNSSINFYFISCFNALVKANLQMKKIFSIVKIIGGGF